MPETTKITLMMITLILLCSSSAHTLAKEDNSSFVYNQTDITITLPKATSYVNYSKDQYYEQKRNDLKDVIAILEGKTSYVNNSNMSTLIQQRTKQFDEALQQKAADNAENFKDNILLREKTGLIEAKITGLQLNKDTLIAKIDIDPEDRDMLEKFISGLDNDFALRLYLLFDHGSEVEKIFIQSQMNDFARMSREKKSPSLSIEKLSEMKDLPVEQIALKAYEEQNE